MFIHGLVLYIRKQGLVLVVGAGVLAVLALSNLFFEASIYRIILDNIAEFYLKWGLIFIFLASIVEGTLFINWYFPGSFIVLSGALLSRQGLIPFWELLAVVFIGFSLAFTLDYFIGRYGFHRVLVKFKFFNDKIVSAQKALQKNAVSTFFIWYIHPQSGNFVATAAGILKYNFFKFSVLNAVSGFLWMLFWTGLVYILGGVVLELIDNYAYLMLFTALVAWVLIGYLRERRSISINIP